jgi:hypothetical protein
MARRFDPILKQWIDEPDAPGALADPTAMPGTVAPELRADPAASQVPQVAVNFPQKPLSEVETERTQRLASPGTVQAEADLVAAEQATDKASTAVGQVEAKEADAGRIAADAKVAALKARQVADFESEQERKRFVDGAQVADDQEIEQRRNAQLDVGNARQTMWAGRPGAEIFTRLLQVVGGTAHDLSGRSGPSPVDQALEANIAAHEKRLVTRWEATKEAHAAKKQGRATYLNELDRRRIEAANQSLLSIDLVGEQLNAAIAGLSKEKQAAARAAADASLNEQRAAQKLQRGQLYEAIGKRSETTRTLPDGAGAPPLAGREDVEAVSTLEQAARDREQLAEQIEKNEDSWKNIQDATKEYNDEEAAGKIPGAGPAAKAASRSMRGQDVSSKLAKSGGFWGRSFWGLLGSPDSTGATIARGVEKVVTQTAKGYGGSMTEPDAARASAELGVQSQSAKQMAATLRRQAQQMREKAGGVRAQRTFRAPGGTATGEPASKAPTKTGSPPPTTGENPNDPGTWSDDRLARARAVLERKPKDATRDPYYARVLSEISARRRKAK